MHTLVALIILFVILSEKKRNFLYLWVLFGSDVLKFGSTLDWLPSHWSRFSTMCAHRHSFLLWPVDPKYKLKGKDSLELKILKYLKGNRPAVSAENEVLHRFDEGKKDMLCLYVKVKVNYLIIHVY